MAASDSDTIVKDHSQLLNDTGMYVFMEPVSSESIKPIVEWILVENHVRKKKAKELPGSARVYAKAKVEKKHQLFKDKLFGKD